MISRTVLMASSTLFIVTIGVLGWLPDLDAFFGIVSRLLRTDGQLFIYEMHPILDMFDAAEGLSLMRPTFNSCNRLWMRTYRIITTRRRWSRLCRIGFRTSSRMSSVVLNMA